MSVTRDQGGKLGVLVDINWDSGLLTLMQVEVGSVIATWNEHRSEEQRVRGGDCIVSVNGILGNISHMLWELQSATAFDIVARRPTCPGLPVRLAGPGSESVPLRSALEQRQRVPVTVQVDPCRPLGLEFRVSPEALSIAEIRDGIIADWNAANPTKEVRVGDRIVFANGARREQLLVEVQKQGLLHLVVSRGWNGIGAEVLSEASVDEMPLTLCAGCVGTIQNEGVCAICQDRWVCGTHMLRLPCGHHFHQGCAVEWLTKHSLLCPLCGWPADHPDGPQRAAKVQGIHGMAPNRYKMRF